MGIPPILNVCRHDTDNQAPVTSATTGGSPRRLRERLLTEHRAPPGVTLADRPDQPILAALRRWDRRDTGDGRRAADGAVLLALVIPSGVRTAVRPTGLGLRSWTRWSR
ncbi:hypothetical protein AB8A21_04955 [Streptomyces sp. BF23-18]|uniref:hypothetical protein n=1 Tax=Streptomyces sp. BF23-18 TaxID=3240282 RepID=UPI0034E44AF3